MTSCGQRVNVTWALNAVICFLVSERQRVSEDTDNHKRKVLWRQKRRLEWCGLKPRDSCTPASRESQEQNLREPLGGRAPPTPGFWSPGFPGCEGTRFHRSAPPGLREFAATSHRKLTAGEKHVSVHSGCCDRIPQGGQLLKNSNFSQFWRLGVQDWVPASLLFGESWLSVSQMVPLHCVLTWKGLGSSLGLFYKGTNSIHEGPISNPNLLPKAPPPKTITLGIWFHHTNLGAGTNHSKVGSELCSQLKYWGAIHSRAFPDASEIKNPLAMQEMLETRVQSLVREDPLEEEMAAHSSIAPAILQYCLENPMDRGACKATVHGVAKRQTWLSDWARMQYIQT